MVAVLLTGARGYLGSAVAAALDDARIDWAPLATRLEAIEPGSLRADCVIHCAGALRRHAARLQRDNVQGTACLLAGLRGAATRVLFASSRSVYGAGPGQACDESLPPAPNDEYGRSKWAAEQLLRADGRAVLCCRLATLWGPAPHGDCPSLPHQVLHQWLRGEPASVVAEDVAVDYLAVTDAARLLVELAQRPWPDDALNLPGPRRSLHALVHALAGAARRCGHDATIRRDYPPAPRWPTLQDRRLRHWLPDFRHSDDGEVAMAWLEQTAGG